MSVFRDGPCSGQERYTGRESIGPSAAFASGN
jgi:hypothetical protein